MSLFGRLLSSSQQHFLSLRSAGITVTFPNTALGRRALAVAARKYGASPHRHLPLPQHLQQQQQQRALLRTPVRPLTRSSNASSSSSSSSSSGGARRTLADDAKGGGNPKQQQKKKQSGYGNDPNQTQLQTWTVAKGVKTGMTLSLQLGLAGLVLVCGGLIVKELMPTKMSPNAVFDSAFERLQREPRITNYFGKNLKAYGRDRSRGAAGMGKVEGRRNFVDHVEYDDENGVHHTRVMFNIEGASRKGVVYADISKEMDAGEFLYLIVQDRANPARKWAIVDNRPQTPFAVRQGEIADHLVKKGVVLYGSNSEPNTVRQLELFGEACKQLVYVDCYKQPEKCQAAGIEALPTWSFNGQKEVGVKEIEDLYTRASKHQGSVFKNL